MTEIKNDSRDEKSALADAPILDRGEERPQNTNGEYDGAAPSGIVDARQSYRSGVEQIAQEGKQTPSFSTLVETVSGNQTTHRHSFVHQNDSKRLEQQEDLTPSRSLRSLRVANVAFGNDEDTITPPAETQVEKHVPRKRKAERQSARFEGRESGTEDYSKVTVESAECYIEPESRIRTKNLLKTPEELGSLLATRKFIPISELRTRFHHGDDSSMDWYTIGVLGERSSPKTSANNKKYVTLKFTDLAGNFVNTFLFDGAFETHWKEVAGSVVVLANADVVQPTERHTNIGLSISNPDKFMKFGHSVDLTTCKATRRDGQACSSVLDIRQGDYCDYHAVSALKNKKTKRQEFAVADAPYHIGPPKPQRKVEAAAAAQRVPKTYLFPGGFSISTHDQPRGHESSRAALFEQQQKATLKQDSSLRRLLERSDNSLALAHLAKAAGIAPVCVGGPDDPLMDADTIKKIGFDPFAGGSPTKPRLQERSPSKDTKPKLQERSPLKDKPSTSRAPDDERARKTQLRMEDFDDELVIIGMPERREVQNDSVLTRSEK
ncbi:minichromosome maintenance- protein [Gonapodya sp. JEL0774]|nr:minichromosome maintenance- protein [Gonapodya sp. JEL0774]